MTSQASRVPSPATLTAYDCWRLLETEDVARVAWVTDDGGAAVVPVNYIVGDGAVWFRTQPYSQLGRQCGGGRILLEVDHVDRDEHTAWSVVVSGTADLVPTEDVPDDVMEMRLWAPGTRNLFVRLEPIEVSGRRL